MNTDEFVERLNGYDQPVIIDIWAPWCGPCRQMDPAFKRLSKEYEGRVVVWKINADSEPELMKTLAVMGIPTIIGYANGKRVFRKTGAQGEKGLRGLFEAVLGNQPVPSGIRLFDRLLRLGSSIAVGVLGWLNGPNYLLLGIALILAFSAVYDRCPIYQAIAPRLLKGLQSILFGKNDTSTIV
jgi:thioredoxin